MNIFIRGGESRKKLLVSALLLPVVAFSSAVENCFTFLKAGDLKRAMEEGKRAVRLYPQNSLAHLSIARSLGERKMQANLLNNIGMIYRDKGDTDRALFYYTKSLELKEREEDKATTYNNIAFIYLDRGDHKKAEEFYKKALVAFELAGDLRGSGAVLINLGGLYIDMKRYDLAREKLEEGIKRVERVGDVYWTAEGYGNLGLLERALGRYEEALGFLKMARELYIQAGASHRVQQVDVAIKLTEGLLEKTSR